MADIVWYSENMKVKQLSFDAEADIWTKSDK